MKITVLQQGDVILIKRTDIDFTQMKDLKSTTVQEGEHTGHAHRFRDGGVQMFEQEGVKYLRVVAENGSTLTHEEHLPQTIEKGDYEVRIVRQKDIFSGVVSAVID